MRKTIATMCVCLLLMTLVVSAQESEKFGVYKEIEIVEDEKVGFYKNIENNNLKKFLK